MNETLKSITVYVEEPGKMPFLALQADNAFNVCFKGESLSFFQYVSSAENPNHKIKRAFVYSMASFTENGEWFVSIKAKRNI